MTPVTETGTTADLRSAIERSGYYPELVAESLDSALAGEPVRAFLVHHEATFDRDELRRHVTVLVLTASRLVVAHTDDHPADEVSPLPTAVTTTESVPIARLGSVMVSRTVSEPATYRPGSSPSDVVLTLGWGAVSRLDLEPASCSDPDCEGDHGYTGTATADDLSVRVSEVGDGSDGVHQALAFASAVNAAVAAARA
jgi:Family of unknown function (DUF5998)